MNDAGFGIYLHWPYCSTICPYCDFNVYRARGAHAEPLLAAMEADLFAHAARFGPRPTRSLFFGGGTPSLLNGGQIARLIDAASRAFAFEADCEITLEANPEDAPRFAEHVTAGINRLSLGVQAFDDASLRALGRKHDAAGALRAVETAAQTGARVSLDLIYAREGQGIEPWLAELDAALKLPVEHLSLYQLTLEPGTAFARKAARGALTPLAVEAEAALYEATQAACEAAGFAGYEISNHARSDRAQARHNLIYWRGGDWIGIGPGAHGRITHQGARVATEAQRRPGDYINAVREKGLGWLTDEQLTSQQVADELLLMGLRVSEGVELTRVNRLRAKPLNRAVLAGLAEQELVAHADGRIRLTQRGRLLANRIAAELAF